MELKQILKELNKKKTRWEKQAFIQLVLEQEEDPEITEKLSKIKETLKQRTGPIGRLKIPEAPNLEETSVTELEQMVEEAPETQQGTPYVPLTPSIQGVSTQEDYTPLQTQDEVAQQVQGPEQYEYGQEPIRRDLIDFVDWDLRGKVFNKQDDEIISKGLDDKIKEDAYKRRVGHG